MNPDNCSYSACPFSPCYCQVSSTVMIQYLPQTAEVQDLMTPAMISDWSSSFPNL